MKDSNALLSISYVCIKSRPLDKKKSSVADTKGVFYTESDQKDLMLVLYDCADKVIKYDLGISALYDYYNNLPYKSQGRFITSAVGDIDNDGYTEIVSGVTFENGNCYLGYYKFEGGKPNYYPIIAFYTKEVNLIRSIAIGDVNGDGNNEIVIGTRPNGFLILFSLKEKKWHHQVLDKELYGTGKTNIRNIVIGNFGNHLNTYIFATLSSIPDSKDSRMDRYYKWTSTPGSILMYSFSMKGWKKQLVDNHNGITHSRMLELGDADNDGKNELISTSVGVFQRQEYLINPKPKVSIYKFHGNRIIKNEIDELTTAIKSRSAAVSDIDGDGLNEVILGTRNMDQSGLSYLFIYKYQAETDSYNKKVIDTSGELGFHFVQAGDFDNDGENEIIASDDSKGEINIYKNANETWEKIKIIDHPFSIFVANIDMIVI